MTRYDGQPHVTPTISKRNSPGTLKRIRWACHPHHLEPVIDPHNRDLACLVCGVVDTLPHAWELSNHPLWTLAPVIDNITRTSLRKRLDAQRAANKRT